MILATTPVGTSIGLAENLAEDRAYFELPDLSEAARYYAAEGYVVLRGLLEASLCNRILTAFDGTVRGAWRPILRQHNMRHEPNAFDCDGLFVRPIFNVHGLETRHFHTFRTATLDLLTHERVARVTARLLDAGRTKLAESMFSEGSAAAWTHQDTGHQDGIGIGSWFSLEDMAAGTGRLYVCPGSHRLPVIRNKGPLNLALSRHEQPHVLSLARRQRTEWRSPYLAKGDALFWNSRITHGSMPARQRATAHRSLTAHYLREGEDMPQFHSRIRRQEYTVYNGMKIERPYNPGKWRHRLIHQMARIFRTASTPRSSSSSGYC